MHERPDVAQFAPAGLFYDFAVDIHCDNPLLSAQQVGAMGCSAPTDAFPTYIGRRNVEGGPRFADFKHDTYRGVFGFRGDINDAWRYDVSYQYAEVDNNIRNSNYVDTANIVKALNVVNDPTLGVVCQSVVDGRDPSVRAVEHLPDRRRHAGGAAIHRGVVLRDQFHRPDGDDRLRTR